MNRGAYYNEFDPFAAQWLRNLIAEGLIAPGDVDERSIKDVSPDDLRGYTQAHFFAGIGGWSYAARLAGWPDDRPLWTGSCPCQPFSVAGKGAGADDPRHLWPDFFRLIRACRPAIVMGEQVAGAAGYGWLDGVRADLAGEGYASRGVDIPACAVDAPHIRSRIYWCATRDVALSERAGEGRRFILGPGEGAGALAERAPDQSSGSDDRTCAVADADRRGPAPHGRDAGEVGGLSPAQRRAEDHAALPGRGDGTTVVGLAHPLGIGPGGRALQPAGDHSHGDATGRREGSGRASGGDEGVAQGDPCGEGLPASEREDLRGSRRRRQGRAASQSDGAPAGVAMGDTESIGRREGRPEHGLWGRRNAAPGANAPVTFWSRHAWIECHDGKARRIPEPGFPLLAPGLSGRVALGDAIGAGAWVLEAQAQAHLINRVGAWRGFGNAVNARLAAEVLKAFMECAP